VQGEAGVFFANYDNSIDKSFLTLSISFFRFLFVSLYRSSQSSGVLS
jgi:hypothetical protein